MVRIKLENLGPPDHKASATPLAGPSSSSKSGAGGVAGAVFGAPGNLAKGALSVGARIRQQVSQDAHAIVGLTSAPSWHIQEVLLVMAWRMSLLPA